MGLPEDSRFRFSSDMTICRILNGMWQVSGGHGAIDPRTAIQDMLDYHESGFTTWDLADHYGPAEDFVGEFRRSLGLGQTEVDGSTFQAFTKWVPAPGSMTRDVVEGNIRISLRRMDVPALDLLQFHWWDYTDSRYLEALEHLARLREEGVIRHLGLTNFDTRRMAAIASHGIGIVSNQVQYSIIDRRPEVAMAEHCREHGVHLLAYGTLCGGLLSEKYLGVPEPGRPALNTVSLRKYKGMVDAWGGWDLFQDLLACLKGVADRHQVSLANVAVRYILDKPAVAGVIVGARLGVADHREDNARVFSLTLDGEDRGKIEEVLGRSRDLYRAIGDCGDEYRR